MRRALSAVLLLAIPVMLPGQAQETPAPPADLNALQTAVAAVEAGTPDRTSAAYRTNVPLAALQVRKARLAEAMRGMLTTGAGGLDTLLSTGAEALARFRRGEAAPVPPGVLTECAYTAANDGTAQPYYVYLPPGYTADHTWPLIVFLHGYVPSTSILDPWLLNDETCRVAADRGCLLLLPYGRRNTDFQGPGEVDILASTEEMKARFPVDPKRIHISGVSMGGMGAWNVALRHPGMYAAATPMSGQTDMHTWWPRVLPDWPRQRDGIPPFRRLLVEWDNPIDLVANARNQSIFVQHGELDQLIPVAQSRTMVAEAAKLGIPIKLYEFAGESHYIYWDLPCFRNAWSWTKDFTLDESPRRVTFKTFSLEYDTAFWVRIADFAEWGTAATLDCQVSEDGQALTVTAANVRLLEVDLAKAPLAKQAAYAVTVNGTSRRLEPDANGRLLVLCADEPRAAAGWPPPKRKGLCGPVEEVFDGRFLLVAGTAGADADDAASLQHLRRWAQDWDQFADGLPRAKYDTQVSDEEIAACNLVLFGTPATNSLLARLADRLPIQIGDHRYTVAGRTFEGKDLGLVLCYPNPLAPQRYIAVYAGEPYGARCGVNHKNDLIPDFIVFNTRHFNYDDTNEHEVAGYFDMGWQLSPKLTWVREPAAAGR